MFKETYRFKIQNRTQREAYPKSEGYLTSDQDHNHSPPHETILQTLLRPVRLLFSSPVVLMTSLYIVLTYGISYLILTPLLEII